MHLTFCGCRGSTPVSGPEYARYGTATSCVAVAPGPGEPPDLVLDAGTGFINLRRVLGGRPLTASVFITHLHWDHTHGLPFLRQASMPGHRVDIRIPGQGADAEEVMNRAFSPPHFPVPISGLGEHWSLSGIEPGSCRAGRYEVLAQEIPHKGSRTFGYRVSDGSSSIAYLPDHRPLGLGLGPDGLGELHPAALALCDGADLVIHDSQHTAAEMPALSFLGHSAVEYALGLGAAAGAARVALFHHDPLRSDDAIDALVEGLRARAPVPFFAAREAMEVSLPGGEPDWEPWAADSEPSVQPVSVTPGDPARRA